MTQVTKEVKGLELNEVEVQETKNVEVVEMMNNEVVKGLGMEEVVEMREELLNVEEVEMMEELAMDFDDDDDFDFDFNEEDDFDIEDEEEEVKPAKKSKMTTEEVVEEDEDDFDLEADEAGAGSEEDDFDIEDEDDFDIEDEDDFDIEEDEEEEVKPVKPAKKETKKVSVPKKETKKPAAKKETKKATTTKKAPAKKTTTKKSNGLGFKTAAVAEPQLTYQDMLEEIKVNKVDAYNEIMEARAAGTTKQLPGNKKINKSDFVRLMSLKSKESDLIQKALLNLLKQLGITVPEEMKETVLAKCNFNLAQSRALYEELFVDIAYDLVSIGSGLEMIDKEDCKFSFAGERIDEKIVDNAKLASVVNSKTNATMIKDYVKVTSSSKAPESCKIKGNLKNGKFVPVKESK